MHKYLDELKHIVKKIKLKSLGKAVIVTVMHQTSFQKVTNFQYGRNKQWIPSAKSSPLSVMVF